MSTEITLILKEGPTGAGTIARLHILDLEGEEGAQIQRLSEPEIIGERSKVEYVLERIATLNPLRVKGGGS